MKKIQSLIIALSLLLNSGCTPLTVSLWEKKSYVYSHDTIRGFNADAGKAVFFGGKYHYAFNDGSGLIERLLRWNGKPKLVIGAYDFAALPENYMQLSVPISLDPEAELSVESLKNLSKNERILLTELGLLYKPRPGSDYFFSKKRDLYFSGSRYLPKPGVDYNAGNSSLGKEHKIKVREEDATDYLGITKKIILTPVTVVGDAILVVAVCVTCIIVIVRMTKEKIFGPRDKSAVKQTPQKLSS